MQSDMIVSGPEAGAGACVIFLHGLGADGGDFLPIVRELALPGADSIRFLFPHAPVRPVTINRGYRMRAWFDILGFEPTDPVDAEGIAASVARVRALVEAEIVRGVPAGRIVLAGFSQGGVVALGTGLGGGLAIGGIIALSTWLPQAVQPECLAPSVRQVPVFVGHGVADDVVPLASAHRALARLEALGMRNVRLREYPMAHGVGADEVADLRAWLVEVLGRTGQNGP
jgi:phospholipase/carboxylesterase